MDLLIPPKSPVRFAAIGPQDSVVFKGRFRLCGRYHCGWRRRNGAARELEVHFFPDQEFRTCLPYWHDHRQLVELGFDNVDDFLRAALREAILNGLRSGVVPAVSGRVGIEVEGFRAALAGKSPVYTVRFVSVSEIMPAETAHRVAEVVV